MCTDKKRCKDWKLITIAGPVGLIFAVGGLLIGNRGKHNRPDDSVSNLFTDLHAYPVRHETLTLAVPQGSRIPLDLFSTEPELLCSVRVKCQQSLHSLYPSCSSPPNIYSSNSAWMKNGWSMCCFNSRTDRCSWNVLPHFCGEGTHAIYIPQLRNIFLDSLLILSSHIKTSANNIFYNLHLAR